MKKPILKIDDLRIERGDTVILDGISWQVDRGQHWVILGANGSGKTSLLKALTAYQTPTAGGIAVLGAEYGRADWRELRLKIGMVSSAIRQLVGEAEPAEDVILSGKFAMINFWGRAHRADRARALRVLRQVECGHLAGRRWGVLSQGERQRLLIGRALMGAPRLLILDEPCAGLDPVAREQFLRFVQRLGSRRNAPSLVFVTHHVEEIAPVFSHVLILKDGRVVAAGEKDRSLTSATLSKAFGIPIALRTRDGRYELTVRAPRTGVVA